MAQDTSELYLPATGYIYVAAPGTAAPTDLQSFNLVDGDTEWENVGHTSEDELPEFGFDGGDTESIGTWQLETVRSIQTEAVADYVTFNAHQFNDLVLSLYYGGDGGSQAGQFQVQSGSTAQDKALLIIVVDGMNGRVGFHAPETTMRRDDSVSMETDAFAYFPIRADFLSTGTYKFAWLSDSFGAGGTS